MRLRITLATAISVASISLAGAAAAAASSGAAFVEVGGGELQQDGYYECGIGPLHWTLHEWSRVVLVPHGRDRVPYFSVRGTATETFTRNGVTATSVLRFLDKDLAVTENGDGTTTVTVLATGNATLYGPDGKAVARNPGQTRFVIYFDAAGNPTPGPVVKGSTGRSDDFCVGLHSVLG